MKTNSKSAAYLRFFMDTLRYKPLLTIINVICNAGIFSYSAAIAYLVRQILNQLQSGARGSVFASTVPYLFMILAVSLSRIGFIMSCAVLDGKRSYFYQNRVRINILRRIYKRNNITSTAGSSGRIFEVLDDDVPVCLFPPELLTEVTGHFVYTMITIGLLVFINWRVTLFVFIPLSVAIYGVQKLSDRVKEKRKSNREAHDDVSTFIGDVADCVLSIKTAGASSSVLGQFDERNKRRRHAILSDALFNVKIGTVLNLSVTLGVIIMMFVASRLLVGDSFKIGDFSIFIASLGTLGDCINRIVELVYESKKAEVSYERILEAVESQDHRCLLADPGIALKGEISLEKSAVQRQPLEMFEARKLTFTYAGDGGFRDVDMTVRRGEVVAIAGGVGSGKSTLLSVLSGGIKSESGKLLWNSKPVNDTGAFNLPPNMAYSSQRSRFFSSDILTNICLGDDIPSEGISRAVNLAALDEALGEMPNGMHTFIGNRGDMLSGGQRQRLALTRMLARNAELYIVDDCVSALDEATQQRVRDGVLDHIKSSGHGMIIATNLKSFLSVADRIVVLKKGYVVAQGSYPELCKNCEEFMAVVS